MTAAKLDPAQHRYLFHYANLLVNNERDAEARRLVQKIGATADSPQEKAEAEGRTAREQELTEKLEALRQAQAEVVEKNAVATELSRLEELCEA